MRRPLEAGPAASLPRGPGTYVLLLRVERRGRVTIGRLGPLAIAPGVWAYVGSARGPGGLRARVSHHLRPARRPHWHVDFLRRRARPVAIWFRVGRTAREHVWARTVAADPRAVETLAGFGASDCRCDSHLFRFEVQPEPLPALGADVVQIAAV